MPRPLDSLEEFYAHALAIEHEAVERYDEFATWFDDRGEEVMAGLARTLAEREREHYHQLLTASQGLDLPPVAARRYQWLDEAEAEAPARELLFRIATPRQLLAIALNAERNARRFFAWVARTARNPRVRLQAREMAHEEADHVRWVLEAIEYQGPALEWDEMMAAGVNPGTITSSGN